MITSLSVSFSFSEVGEIIQVTEPRSKVIKISSKLASHILKGKGVSEPQESSIKWLERGEWSNG